MIAKISATENLGGALGYNFKKVRHNEASVLCVNDLREAFEGTYRMDKVLSDMQKAIPEKRRTKKTVFHCSLNPHPDEKLSDELLAQIAKEYMEALGYGKQPYIVFKHNDIAREHIHIVSLRVDSNRRKINDKFEETLHFTRAQMLQKPFSTIITKNDRLSFERLLESVCQGENFEGTLRAQNASGQDCWLRASLTTVNDMYGDIAKVIFIANDITREKLMELEMRRQTEQLKEQEEQLRQNEVELNHKLRQAREEVKSQFREIEKVQIRNEKTLEGFLDAIITTDQEGVVEFFNRAAEELFAIDRSEVLGQNIRLLFPPESEDNDFLRAYLDPNAEKIIGERREVNIRTSSGEDISVLMLLSEAKVGRKISYTAFVQNISLDLF